MWSVFAQDSGKCHENQSPGQGSGRYNLWQEDIGLIQELGVSAYRTSISMSRTLHRDGSVNAKAIKWYRNYFQGLREANISLYATLYHWELPNFLHEKGGWKNRDTVDWLVRHARAVYQELGEYIEEYFILNEPWCASFLSYHLGIHAPGETDIESGIVSAHHLLLAQGAVCEELMSLDSTLKVSTVINASSSYAVTSKKEDILAVQYAESYLQRWFLDPLYIGEYPEPLAELYEPIVSKFSKEDMQTIQCGPALESLGINYYCGGLQAADTGETRHKSVVLSDGETNGLGWPVFVEPHYPEGLYDLLQEIFYSYRSHGLEKIYITENGMALKTEWDGSAVEVHDQQRVTYLQNHLQQTLNAIHRGIPIAGYFVWTLMDNYEWAEGYRPESCFGIVHVERPSMKRVKKTSFHWYSELARSRTLSKSEPATC
jgi:beta-glucosidase